MCDSKKIVGSCPVCGGNVVKTLKGFSCENSMGDNPSCKFFVNGVVANRKMTDQDVAHLLTVKSEVFDGFSSNEGKAFSSALTIMPDGSIDLNSKVSVCPRCGGDIFVGMKGFNCSNFKDNENPCNFVVWRNIAGHLVSLAELRQVCEIGVTSEEVSLFGATGDVYKKRLGLSSEKDKVIKI